MLDPSLTSLAAQHAATHLDGVPVGSPVAIDSGAELCGVLEYLLPQILMQRHPEWSGESIDGFFFSLAVKSSSSTVELIGTCILISDQTVTPFALSIRVGRDGGLEALRLRIGEPGGGRLGISGPACHAGAAGSLLARLNDRIEAIEWQYDVAVGDPE